MEWGGGFRNISIGKPHFQLCLWATIALIKSLAREIWPKEAALTRKVNSKESHLWCQAGNMKALSRLAKRNIQEICKCDSVNMSFLLYYSPLFLKVSSGWQELSFPQVAHAGKASLWCYWISQCIRSHFALATVTAFSKLWARVSMNHHPPSSPLWLLCCKQAMCLQI